MRRVKLAYRDDDRTPVIFCIKAMAERHCAIDVEVVQIKDGKEYEAALLDGTVDVLIEHLDYLYGEAARGRRVTFFCAPSKGAGLELVVPGFIESVEDLKGKTMAVRASGQPYAITLWLRMMGLEKEVRVVRVGDDEVGRWGQWKKVLSGECVATFMSPLYLPGALDAGLKILEAPEIPIVGHYAQACLSSFALESSDLLRDYVRAVIHALCLMTLRRDEALEIARDEPMKRMKLASQEELKRQFDAIANGLKIRPYPIPQAVANTFEIALASHPEARGLNPMALWDLHWVKRLDDEGFIDSLCSRLTKS
jgi:hypothetical protein